MNRNACILTVAAIMASVALAQPAVDRGGPDKWLTVTGSAAGTGDKAAKDAVGNALRKAVEEACGVFLTTQSKTRDYKAVYDKVLLNAVGYVKESQTVKVYVRDGITYATVKALVSTQKFEQDWAGIAHTISQEENPRVVMAIVEAVHQGVDGETYDVDENGAVQGKMESFFLDKGVSLMDRQTAKDVTTRDIMLAAIKDDTEKVAALGARFNADVVVIGRATAKYGKAIKVASQTLHQYTAVLNVRVIQCDSARVLTSKSFGPVTYNSMQRGGGEDKAFAKLADESAPKLLAAVVEAWRKRANVARTIALSISGMDYATWKLFRTELEKSRDVRDLNLREITENIANIDIGYEQSKESLADLLCELKSVTLEIVELNPNRLSLKVKGTATPAEISPKNLIRDLKASNPDAGAELVEP